MKIVYNILLWLVRGVLVLSVLGYFLYVIDSNVSLAGVQTHSYVFGTPDSIISHLQPVERTREADGYRRIIEEPVYFDIRSLVLQDSAVVKLRYRDHTPYNVKLGVRMADGGFALQNIEYDGKAGEWVKGRAEFDLKHAMWFDGKYRFVISAPDLMRETEDTEYIDVSDVEITLERPVVTPRMFGGLFKRAVNAVF